MTENEVSKHNVRAAVVWVLMILKVESKDKARELGFKIKRKYRDVSRVKVVPDAYSVQGVVTFQVWALRPTSKTGNYGKVPIFSTQKQFNEYVKKMQVIASMVMSGNVVNTD